MPDVSKPGAPNATPRCLPCTAVGLVFVAIFGSVGWALSMLFLLAGFLAVSATGAQVPSGTWAAAFVVGLPLGAWIELHAIGGRRR